MDAWLINCLLGFTIGLILGFLGGGGSILTVPALVYIVGQSPQAAVSASLIIVGSNAAIGALFHHQHGQHQEHPQQILNWPVALVFGGVGMITAYFSAGLSQLISPTMLMILFALLMLVVGAFMVLSRTPQCQENGTRGWSVVVASGAGVGILTGFLGVGGGFLIVPALVMLVGLPIHQAVGTSLVVIAMNSLAGFMGHLAGTPFDTELIATFVAAGFVGAFVGARLGRILKPQQLRTSFAVFVMVLAVFLLVDNVGKL
ncbi:MAG: sulfite exporter TauE/SafE family protein [Caldilineaceae bacterium]|nr:sulfite exporter TauE/SafE family protein [Caldilineaceae bacterium]